VRLRAGIQSQDLNCGRFGFCQYSQGRAQDLMARLFWILGERGTGKRARVLQFTIPKVLLPRLWSMRGLFVFYSWNQGLGLGFRGQYFGLEL
jgi:hypothetical protein